MTCNPAVCLKAGPGTSPSRGSLKRRSLPVGRLALSVLQAAVRCQLSPAFPVEILLEAVGVALGVLIMLFLTIALELRGVVIWHML